MQTTTASNLILGKMMIMDTRKHAGMLHGHCEIAL